VAHGNPVINGNGIELGSKTTQFGDLFFDLLADLMEMDMTGDKLGKGINNTDDRLAELLFGHTVGPPETAGPGHPAALRCSGAA